MLAGAAGLLASPAVVRAQGSSAGVALVLGNSQYKWEASLPNVKRDAPDVAKRFQALGFKTELVQDASQNAMRTALDKFGSAARGANLAAFYFAGHGASWDKDTYLVPEDADLSNPSTVQSLVSVRSLNDATKEAQHRLLVFDNCRNNPADGWRQRAAAASSQVSKTELAATTLQGANTLAIFSTAPGRVAVDGPAGENSPFAAAFLRQLAGEADLQALPAKLRRDLLIATAGQQVVWDQSTFDQPFLLTNSPSRSSAGSRGTVPADRATPTTSAQIVELPKAYAFARENGLPLAPGLVALRPPGVSPDSQKIGSFKTLVKVTVGSSYSNNASLEPLLLIVLSVADGSTAEIIVSSKDWATTTGGIGNLWRYITGTISGPRLVFNYGLDRADASAEKPYEFKWSDANSGRHFHQSGGGSAFYSGPFTRLD